MALMSVVTVLAAAFRKMALSLAMACSIGLRSGLCLADPGDFVAGEIVEDDRVAWFEGWREDLLNVGAEAFAVHQPVEDTRSGQAVVSQRRNERDRLPMAARNGSNEPLAARASAIAASRVGGGPGFINKNQFSGFRSLWLAIQSQRAWATSELYAIDLQRNEPRVVGLVDFRESCAMTRTFDLVARSARRPSS